MTMRHLVVVFVLSLCVLVDGQKSRKTHSEAVKIPSPGVRLRRSLDLPQSEGELDGRPPTGKRIEKDSPFLRLKRR